MLRMAEAPGAAAHLALALLDEELLESEPVGLNEGVYWFEQQRSGRVLTGVELEWAEDYRRKQNAHISREDHLGRATALGNAEAALRRAEENETFESAAHLASAQHAGRLGEIAMACGRQDDARKWLRTAARQGDTSAMRMLASELESDLKDVWVWVYLARLLGKDLMAYHAVGDDGRPVDADEAGPIYAAGGFELDRLPDDDDDLAKRIAGELYKVIRSC